MLSVHEAENDEERSNEAVDDDGNLEVVIPGGSFSPIVILMS